MYVLLSFIDLWPCYNLSYRRIPYHRKQWVHIVYDPSIALVHVWSQHVMWPNIPQLKQGDIAGYHLSDIPQFSNLTSTMISVHLKFNPRWESDLWLLQTKEIFCLFRVVPKNTQKKISHIIWHPDIIFVSEWQSVMFLIPHCCDPTHYNRWSLITHSPWGGS